MPPDYYALLGVPSSATQRQLKTAYRKRMKEAHPDLAAPEQKAQREALSKQLNEAYNVLSDPLKRRHYDRHRPPTATTRSQPEANSDPLVSIIRGFFNAISFILGRRS